MILKIDNLNKKYGPVPVLRDINLQIGKNDCFCLIGKNGAGKSTLINIIIDLLPPDEGRVELFGATYQNEPMMIKNNIGALPEFNPVIEEFTGIEYLTYVGRIYRLSESVLSKRIIILGKYFFEDTSQLDKEIGKYSKGMKIKIGLCAAVIHKPRFLVLDEPFENLDPLSSIDLVRFLVDYRRQGHAILVSSHDVMYVEKIATHIGILIGTRLTFCNSIEQVVQDGEQFEKSIADLLGYNPKNSVDF